MGNTEKNIKKYFETAEKENAILFLDECDPIILKRDNLNKSWEFSFINTFLKEMENFNGILILSTNYESIRDKAINRRIHFFVKFENPTFENRVNLLKLFIPDQYARHLDFGRIAKIGSNGGHLKNVWIRSGIKLLKGEQIDTEFLISELIMELNKDNTKTENKIGF